MGRRRAWLVLAVCLLGGAVGTRAQEDPRLVRVTPGLSGDQVVCRLQTRGLPGEKQLQSMRSGLVAAVELDLALVDEGDNLLGGRSLSLRMAFDLWDEVFSVRADGRERRFNSLADLRTYLADLQGLPVAPAAALAGGESCRLRVGLVVHAIAPDERQHVEDVIAGEQRSRREGQDQQEATVSLGRLIRLFYKGGGETREGQQLVSEWFTGRGLADAAH